MQTVYDLIQQNLSLFNGFLMAGVILILIGLKGVTLRDMREYRLSHINVKKMDEVIAWSIFYLIFGILIAAGAIISFAAK